MKSCGECTECCKGALTLNEGKCIQGQGNPCPFLNTLNQDKCCEIYDNRPTQCKEYNCWWRKNNDVPDFMRPDKSKIIVTERNIKGINYLDVTAIANQEIPYESLSHIIRYAVLTGKNIIWRHNNYEKHKLFWLGSPQFMKMAQEDQFSFSQSRTDL